MMRNASKENHHHDASGWAEVIRHEPMLAVTAAAITGFFAGGGALTAPGRFATSIVSRIVAREIAAGLASSMLVSMFVNRNERRTTDNGA
jgi:hypothetical protein